ncbi:glycosyltransferase family 2 protein [Paracoccus shandongensis]|uniref:glycosyltransferase family 2 protein n=1 Tax=Paracoccus shandongensis TaxID=2816048 RepID=UPI001A9034E7|nr:glycosyltransferase family A protein [Paracoccus shandongensis]
MNAPSPPVIDAVAIGRNEGQRLVRCLDSLRAAGFRRIVYVDSGSTDGSIATAEARGAVVVRLDMATPFTAARARNAGVAALPGDRADYVQFIDGDCVLDPGWLPQAARFLAENPDAAVACGRLREIAPEASLYNRLIDHEWNTPIGPAKACGGIALFRATAFHAAGGFNPALIAGEEPELCLRLRRMGWQIWRLDAEMARHDAAMHRFSQWWRRARRAGYAYALGAALHGRGPERHNVAQARRALAWGLGIPLAAVLGAVLVHPLLLALLLAWPLQVVRLWRRDGDLVRAGFLTMGKLPEAIGVLEYWWKRIGRRGQRLIEYK